MAQPLFFFFRGRAESRYDWRIYRGPSDEGALPFAPLAKGGLFRAFDSFRTRLQPTQSTTFNFSLDK